MSNFQVGWNVVNEDQSGTSDWSEAVHAEKVAAEKAAAISAGLRYVLVQPDPLIDHMGFIIPSRSSPTIEGFPVAYIGDLVICLKCLQIKPIEKAGGPYRSGISAEVDISSGNGCVMPIDEFAYENDVIHCGCGEKQLIAECAPKKRAKDTTESPEAFAKRAMWMFIQDGWNLVKNYEVPINVQASIGWGAHGSVGLKAEMSIANLMKGKLIDIDEVEYGVGYGVGGKLQAGGFKGSKLGGTPEAEGSIKTEKEFEFFSMGEKPRDSSDFSGGMKAKVELSAPIVTLNVVEAGAGIDQDYDVTKKYNGYGYLQGGVTLAPQVGLGAQAYIHVVTGKHNFKEEDDK